jgi:hypothetical protein
MHGKCWSFNSAEAGNKIEIKNKNRAREIKIINKKEKGAI